MFLDEIFNEAPHILIEQLSCDSRLPMHNCVFFCISGVKYNGHDFVNEAIKNGATVIVYQGEIDTNDKAIYIKVKNVNSKLSQIANIFYKNPLLNLDLYITSGCFGKSSVASIINQLICDKVNTSSIGAYGIKYNDTILKTQSSSLSLLDNYKYLSEIANNNCNTCTLETSSLSYIYNKIESIKPKALIFTNTYLYKILNNYFDSVKKYLYSLENDSLIVLNKDDDLYNLLIQSCNDNVCTYGFNNNATYSISCPEYYIDHTKFCLTYNSNKYIINSPLITKMNIYNLVAAIAALNKTGFDINYLISRIPLLKSPEGLLERIEKNKKNIIIDYCTSYDNVENLVLYIKELKNVKKIYSIISINYGDDETRIERIYNKLSLISNIVIFTENKSYDSDVNELLEIGAKIAKNNLYLTIEDRELAIKTGVELLDKDDLLLVLGKGNEKLLNKNYQKIIYEGDTNLVKKYLDNCV